MRLPTHIHMIGVGGMGMAPLALYLRQTGIRVSGEDVALNPHVEKLLEEARVEMVSAKAAERMRKKAPLTVFSSAVNVEDSRLQQARDAGAEVIRRGELLARLCERRKLLAVVGSHGKTTTAAMLMQLMRQAGFAIDYVLGGLCRDEAMPPAFYMGAPWVMAEVDESDGTIEHFSPELTLAVNFDWDHPDRYSTPEALQETFLELFKRTQDRVIIPQGCETLATLADQAGVECVSFGMQGDYRYAIKEASLQSQSLELGGAFGERSLRLSIGGDFNAHNACAALAATHQLTDSVPESALEQFGGVCRRQDKLYEGDALKVYADYAHHPDEIASLLKHFKNHAEGAMAVAFQPHRYSRTRAYAEAFAQVLGVADSLVLLPVYAASEPLDEQGMTEVIAEKLASHADCVLCKDNEAALAALRVCQDKVNTILFVGAGDIDMLAHNYVQGLEGNPQWWKDLPGKLSKESVLREFEPLGKKTTIRLGGKARWYAEPCCVEDLQSLLKVASSAGVEVFFLGRGSNLIVHDEGFDGLVIHLHHTAWREIEKLDDSRLEVGAGVRLQALSAKACKMGMAGFEFLEGIPGSLGGALRMNAGAMGGWMFDVVEEVEYVTLEGELIRQGREDFHFGYRHCKELVSGVALKAVLRAPSLETAESIRERMQSFAEHRVGSQPREASAGCIFKNPEGGHAGKLIDEVGLKGYHVGNAEISTVHGNFIINHGGATTDDVIAIVRHVREQVKAARGVELMPEVMLVGKRWEDVL